MTLNGETTKTTATAKTKTTTAKTKTTSTTTTATAKTTTTATAKTTTATAKTTTLETSSVTERMFSPVVSTTALGESLEVAFANTPMVGKFESTRPIAS